MKSKLSSNAVALLLEHGCVDDILQLVKNGILDWNVTYRPDKSIPGTPATTLAEGIFLALPVAEDRNMPAVIEKVIAAGGYFSPRFLANILPDRLDLNKPGRMALLDSLYSKIDFDGVCLTQPGNMCTTIFCYENTAACRADQRLALEVSKKLILHGGDLDVGNAWADLDFAKVNEHSDLMPCEKVDGYLPPACKLFLNWTAGLGLAPGIGSLEKVRKFKVLKEKLVAPQSSNEIDIF